MVCFWGPSHRLFQHPFSPAVLLFYKHVPHGLHACSLSLQLQSESHARELMFTILTSDFIGCAEYSLKLGSTCSLSVVEEVLDLGGDLWLDHSSRGRQSCHCPMQRGSHVL